MGNNYWSADQYQLIDFGQGRKLERFGAVVLDRPCPAAAHAVKQDESDWSNADLSLQPERNAEDDNSLHQPLTDWRVHFREIQFQLRVTPFGHVGLFPEHASQWNWLADHGQRWFNMHGRSPALLNLFAYTGGATLLLARQGWQVTHVDSSEPTVHWARHNAQISGLADAPIRWLVEDARVYVARELKRGRKYDAVLLDPPSYGHGPKGKPWQIERHLPQLLQQCFQLLTPDGVVVLTGHSELIPFTEDELLAVRLQAGHRDTIAELSRVAMHDQYARALDFGWCIRSYHPHIR